MSNVICTLKQNITIGTPSVLHKEGEPNDKAQYDEVETNNPCVGFVVGFSVTTTRNAFDVSLLQAPDCFLSFDAQYTGLCPEGFNIGDKFTFEVTFKGKLYEKII